MATRHYLSRSTSDLTGGSDWNRYLKYNTDGTPATIAASIAVNSIETQRAFTEPLHPGTKASVTGNYTVLVKITTGQALANIAITLHRVNSSGTVQTSSSTTISQSASAGTKTFTLTSVNLGTFAETDRLRVDYVMTGIAMGAVTITLATEDPDCYIETPFNARFFTSSP
jgi:hypothetical protein